jgi:hypothetical protein
MNSPNLIPVARIERKILLLRGEKVMLDRDLAELYGVETKALNQAVKRNFERFPADFMFQVSKEEAAQILRSQIVTLKDENGAKPAPNTKNLKSQFVTSSLGHGGRRKRAYAFTEQGVAMLSGVLNSPRAIQTNLAIMRTFVQLRQMLATNADLSRKLATLEGKYNQQFRVVFDAIRALMREQKSPKREIGFHAAMKPAAKTGSAKAKKI